MKICYLVLAFNNPNHFKRLINAIKTPNSRVFVHIDEKSNLQQFQTFNTDDVVFIKKRIKVNWGGFSIVQATLNLLYEALKTDDTFSHFCLLSGSCYPIKSAIKIEQFLQENQGQNFINITKMPNTEKDKPISRITNYVIENEKHYSQTGYIAKIIFRVKNIINLLKIQRNYKQIFGEIEPYAGSQFWILSYSAAKYVMDFMATKPKIVRFFKYTHASDESFFQTIIANSKFVDKVSGSKTFIDWNDGNSIVIDNSYLQYFKKSPQLFARKFPNDSAKLVDFIQTNIWQ